MVFTLEETFLRRANSRKCNADNFYWINSYFSIKFERKAL